MYIIKEPGIIKFMIGDFKTIAKKIGINNCTLSRILNGKQATRYLTAYFITKLYNKEAEIEDYFIKTK